MKKLSVLLCLLLACALSFCGAYSKTEPTSGENANDTGQTLDSSIPFQVDESMMSGDSSE